MQRSRFDARARSVGLTSAQWRVIAAVRFAEGATQSDIASQLEISNVTAGRIIDRLEENGWIERRADPGDLRANRLFLKPAVTPVLERLTTLARDEEAIALAGLSETERASMADLLQRVIDNMQVEKPEAVPSEDGPLPDDAACPEG